MANVALRTQRLETRLLPEQKKRIERAANIRGISVSDFMVQTADEAALRTMERHEQWVLSENARDVFMRALMDPGHPNEHLRLAAADHRERVRR